MTLPAAFAFSWRRRDAGDFRRGGECIRRLVPRGAGLELSQHGQFAAVVEDPRVPPQWSAPRASLFHAARHGAVVLFSSRTNSAEVHFTTMRQDSPRGAVVATSDSDGVTANWAAGGAACSAFRREGDLRPQAGPGATLNVRYRVDRAPEAGGQDRPALHRALCGTRSGAMLDVTRIFKNAPMGDWQTLVDPVGLLCCRGRRPDPVTARLRLRPRAGSP